MQVNIQEINLQIKSIIMTKTKEITEIIIRHIVINKVHKNVYNKSNNDLIFDNIIF
jgi:hypothetical protein